MIEYNTFLFGTISKKTAKRDIHPKKKKKKKRIKKNETKKEKMKQILKKSPILYAPVTDIKR